MSASGRSQCGAQSSGRLIFRSFPVAVLLLLTGLTFPRPAGAQSATADTDTTQPTAAPKTAEEPVGRTRVVRSTEARLRSHVGFLASDTLEGRQAGLRGGQAAAAYLISELKRIGLQPAGQGKDFRQPFGSGFNNVLAILPGTDPQLAGEILLVGAHYDHVGYGNANNSYGPYGRIHNGADDNASGVALLLELAESLAAEPVRPRTILFGCWDAEEAGLLGSRHWVQSPTVSRDQIRLAINLDMVGRLSGETVHVMGWRSAAGLRTGIARANRSSLRFQFAPTVTDDSDHYSFYAARIPILHFDTGKHDDYHRPSDDADKLNWSGLLRLRQVMLAMIQAFVKEPELPAFRAASWNERVATETGLQKTPPAPRLGVSWNPELILQGIFEVQQVTPGFPAARIGLQAGDRLLQFGTWDGGNFDDLKTAITTSASEVTLVWQSPQESGPKTATVRLSGTPVTHGLTLRFDPVLPGCAIVEALIETALADRQGLWPGDVIMGLDNQPISSQAAFDERCESATRPVLLQVERRGEPFQVRLPVTSKPDDVRARIVGDAP